MRVLYLNGGASDASVTTPQLAQIAPGLQISPTASIDEVSAELRKGGWQGLLTSPAINEHATFGLIAKLRQDRVPVAIVPVVTEWRQEFFSAAVAAGADDVLLVKGGTAVHVAETLSRMRQSPHLVPTEERRLRVLYVGKDTLVWNLLEQVPFIRAERATSVADGAIAGRTPQTGLDSLRTDTVVVDDQPGEGPSLQVVKFVRAQSPDLPIVVLASAAAGESASGILDLGVDDCIPKSGIYRRRLIASLNRIHQRHDLAVQHAAIKGREARLRQIVENMPEGLTIISADGTILAANGAALPLFSASKPADVVGREFHSFVAAEHKDEARAFVARVGGGQAARVEIDIEALDHKRRHLQIDGVMLERDARGGRGVIAVLRPPRVATPREAEIAKANLDAVTAEAKSRVDALGAQLQKAAQAHHAERTAWDAARARLEERLQELLADTDVRQGLEMRLASAEAELREVKTARQQLEAELQSMRTELHEANDSRAAERSMWDAARQNFETRLQEVRASAEAHDIKAAELERVATALREMTEARDQATGGLEAARAELRDAAESHLAERASWDTHRLGLEARLADTDAKEDVRSLLELQLAAACDEHRATSEALDAARAESATARTEFLAVRHELDGVLAERGREHSERERERAEIESLRAELRRTLEEHETERASTDATRAQLESKLGDAQTSAVARVEVEARLEAARADLRQAADTFAAERAGWEATRRQLEVRLHETQASAGARGDLEAQLDAARAELRYLTENSTRDRTAWESARRTLEHDLQIAQQAHAAERDAWQHTRQDLDRQLAARGGAEVDRQKLQDALRSLEARHESFVESQSVDRATRERERAELETLRATVDEERGRRLKLDDVIATMRAERDDQLATIEQQHAARRRSFEAHIEQVEGRASRLAAASDAARRDLEAERSALASERDRLAESALYGYALTTLDGRLIRCNETFARVFGYHDSREALARTSGRVFPPMADRAALDTQLLAERAIPQFESCLERVDGTPMTLLESAAIVSAPAGLAGVNGHGELVERIVVDMSGSLALEGRLRQARRLEEVGTLATAMAPDISELLASIDEMGAQLSSELSAHDASRARADKIRKRAARAGNLVRQLAAFGRRQVQAPAPVDLNAAVGRAESVLMRLVGGHVEFDIKLGKADGVAANEDDLEQLLTTLVVSGRDLLPVGGTLVLETRRLDFDPSRDADNRSGLGVVLSVTACGYGVQPLQHAPAVEIVAGRCGGEVRVSGEPGRRASLEVYFPRLAPARPGRTAVPVSIERDDTPVDRWSWTPD